MNKVLITGTTSGIGQALLALFLEKKWQVVCVNRRVDKELQEKYPTALWRVSDVCNPKEVFNLVKEIEGEGKVDYFILNAGINRPDNFDGLDFETFERVMSTNLTGVMTFIGAIHDLNLSERKILSISSTSNIVPNPAHVGYYLSKKALLEAFRLLQSRNKNNTYQSIVLGPVRTNIMSGYKMEGLQKKVFDILSVDSKKTAEACIKLLESNKPILYYPLPSCLFYFALRIVLYFLPGIYKGTLKPSHVH